jgi:IMP and pyridine-specific 5'-nucleotidase
MEPELYQPVDILNWGHEAIAKVLDTAEYSLNRCIEEMQLPATILRKTRAVGLIPTGEGAIVREQLDECVLATQQRILKQQRRDTESLLPFCAFNGGSDVWVDIGNKLIGVQVLQTFLGATPSTTLHVGDQFLSTGNDFATRSACCTLWIVSPQETSQALVELTTHF